MRLLWSSEQLDLVKRFWTYLAAQGIQCTLEEEVARDWGRPDFGARTYHLWIFDEDDVPTAKKYLAAFLEAPTNAHFAMPLEQPSPVRPRIMIPPKELPISPTPPAAGWAFLRRISVTGCIIFICTVILFWEQWRESAWEEVPLFVRQSLVTLSPAKKMLFYDYPEAYQYLDKIVALYGYEGLAQPESLPPPGKFLLQQYLRTPAWPGIYPYIVSDMQQVLHVTPEASSTLPALHTVQLFEKEREGQLWRLVSPMLLHNDILHLFFNMVWLLLLGTQMEERMGVLRYLVFIVLSAAFSNTSQYLMSGPNFIGFSGVICAMATFIYTRQIKAPWEGYLMSPATFRFLLFFILFLALLACIAFFLDIFQHIAFPIAIANTAHVSGAVIGLLLGRLSFFSWRHDPNNA